MSQTEEYLIGLMRDVCEELGLPEEKGERCPILEALNNAHNRGAQGCAERFARQGLLKAGQLPPNGNHDRHTETAQKEGQPDADGNPRRPGPWRAGSVEREGVFGDVGNLSLMAPYVGRNVLRTNQHFVDSRVAELAREAHNSRSGYGPLERLAEAAEAGKA